MEKGSSRRRSGRFHVMASSNHLFIASTFPSSLPQLTPKQNYEELGYYTWIYEGSQTLSNFMTFLIIAGFLAITCFPIWPHFLKVRTPSLPPTLQVSWHAFLMPGLPSLPPFPLRYGCGTSPSPFSPSCSASSSSAS